MWRGWRPDCARLCGGADYGKHANSVLEVVDGLLEPFERSERGRCGGGGVQAVPGGADYGKHANSVIEVDTRSLAT